MDSFGLWVVIGAALAVSGVCVVLLQKKAGEAKGYLEKLQKLKSQLQEQDQQKFEQEKKETALQGLQGKIDDLSASLQSAQDQNQQLHADLTETKATLQEAEEEKVRGQIFNVSCRNYRISELALRVREALRQVGVDAEIRPDYGYRGVRSYRVSTRKIEQVLGFRPKVDVEESVADMVEKIRRYGYTDFDNPRYYNIRWMQLLEEAHRVIQVTGSVFEAPKAEEKSS